MATLKLKKPAGPGAAKTDRSPVRGPGLKKRPTLTQAQAEREAREARYQEQLRLRYGDRVPDDFQRRGEPPLDASGRPARGGPRRDPREPGGRDDRDPRGPRGPRSDDRRGPRPEGRGPARHERDERRPPPDERRGPRAEERRGPRPDDRHPPRPHGDRHGERHDPRHQERHDAPRGRGRHDDPRGDLRGDPRGNDRRPPRGPDARGPGARGPEGRDSGRWEDRRHDRRPDERGDGWHDSRREGPAGPRGTRPAPGDRSRALPPARPMGGPNTAFGGRPARGPLRPPARHEPGPHAFKGRAHHDDDDEDDDDEKVHPEIPGSMRLSKRMSELGIASRREADEWIPKGWVRVDGKVVTELGSRVLPGQLISIEAKARDAQAMKVTVLLHKPIGYVSGQAEDGYEPASVLITPENQWREDRSGIRFLRTHHRGLAPAGRLDIDSTGLLVLTQDGRIAKQLIGEDSETDKEYLVRVESLDGQRLSDDKLALLNHGLELDGEPLKPAQVEWLNDDQLRFVLHEGKKRQIRRMCEAVGLKVVGLKRVRIGQVMLGDLPPGSWRYLRGGEKF